MKQELEIIKKTFKLGNSAGVLLPIEWRNREVLVKLISRSITQELLEILQEKDLLKNTIAVFLAGSYARGEEELDSDVDILVITNDINKNMKIGKYEIILISRDRFEKLFPRSLYLASLIHESKVILNSDYLQKYKNKILTVSTKGNLEGIKSMTKINEEIIKFDEETGERILDGTVYSLVLRLRELYLIDCLKNNKNQSKKEFKNLVKKISSEECYKAYLRIKNDLKPKQVISVEEAMAIVKEIKKRVKDLEHGKKK